MKIVLSFVVLVFFALSSYSGEQRRMDGRDKKTAGVSGEQTRSVRKGSADKPSRNTRTDQEKGKERTGRTESQQNPRRTEINKRRPETPAPETLKESEREYHAPAETDPWERIQGREGQTGRSGTDHRGVFEDVRAGLKSGRMNSLSELLAPKVHVSLRGGESGYFSSSQAYYVLENYLRENKFSEVDFTTMVESGNMPYATGRANFDHNGVHDAAQVYVSLSQVGERWVINQIKIY